MGQLGYSHHFLYASSGPSVGQWWMAHGAGGRLVAGAVRLQDIDDNVGRVLAALAELKLERDTIVVYFSDNGPNGARWNGGMKAKRPPGMGVSNFWLFSAVVAF